jgi:cytosine/adenosine deaminase-related metal-dependent hydrolase
VQLKRQELEALEMDLESESKTLNAYEAEAATLQHGINATLYEKQRALEKLASVQVCPRTSSWFGGSLLA